MKWLKSIWTILGSIVAGVLLGLYRPELALKLVPYGELYLSFLKMCVIPIMVTAIVSSVGRLFMSSGPNNILIRMILISTASMLIVSALGLITGLLANPGTDIPPSSKAVLGTVLLDTESASATAPESVNTGSSLMEFVFKLIPENIFIALGQGNNLQILFFSVVTGIALGTISARGGDQFLSMTDLLFKVFQRVISWSMYLLPFGLLCIMAGQVASTGMGLMLAMFKFIGLIHVMSVILMIVSGCVIAFKLKISFIQSLSGLKDSLIIAFGTQYSIATMPSVLDALRERFKLDADSVNLVVPLSVVVCRYSMVMIYSLGLVFIAQLYGVQLGWQDLLVILIGAVLASVAGAGVPGIVSISMIGMIATPLHLPHSAGVILLMAIIPVINPIITTANIHLNSAAAVLIIDKSREEDKSVEQRRIGERSEGGIAFGSSSATG